MNLHIRDITSELSVLEQAAEVVRQEIPAYGSQTAGRLFATHMTARRTVGAFEDTEPSEVAGVMSYRVMENTGSLKIVQLAVEKSRQGRGIGSLLLHHADDIARRNGLGRVRLTAVDSAKHFYIDRGFVPVEYWNSSVIHRTVVY